MLPIDITITLTFLRSMMISHDAIQLSTAFTKSTDSLAGVVAPSVLLGKQRVDLLSPLVLHPSQFFHTIFENYNHTDIYPHPKTIGCSFWTCSLCISSEISTEVPSSLSTQPSIYPPLPLLSYMRGFNLLVSRLAQPCSFSAENLEISGQSVYWQSIFQKLPDPTFVLLIFVWYAMYAWDKALKDLYEHICSLVS